MSRLLWIVGAVVRLARLPHVWERISDRILSERLETILHLNHIIAFVWFAIGSAESSNTGLHWLEQTIWLGDHTLPDEADPLLSVPNRLSSQHYTDDSWKHGCATTKRS